jgi:hypothetical protein
VNNLPPVAAPLIRYGASVTAGTMPNNVAIGGPMYAYDRNLKSGMKFPPHLHNSWVLMTTYGSPSSGGLWLAKLDSVTPALVGVPQQQATTGTVRFTIRNPIHALYGPEGALYVLFYGSTGAYGSGNNPGLIRIAYNGSCHLLPVAANPGPRHTPGIGVLLRGNSLLVREAGDHTLTLHDLSGRLLLQEKGVQGASYPLSEMREKLGLKAGIYALQVHTAIGSFVRNVSLF